MIDTRLLSEKAVNLFLSSQTTRYQLQRLSGPASVQDLVFCRDNDPSCFQWAGGRKWRGWMQQVATLFTFLDCYPLNVQGNYTVKALFSITVPAIIIFITSHLYLNCLFWFRFLQVWLRFVARMQMQLQASHKDNVLEIHCIYLLQGFNITSFSRITWLWFSFIFTNVTCK